MLQVYNINRLIGSINIQESEFFFPLSHLHVFKGNVLEPMKFCYELIFSDPVESREVLQKHLLQLFIFWLNS